MSGFFDVIHLLIECGTLLGLALMVLVAWPQGKLRDVLLQIVGWSFAALCGALVISPIDLCPEAIFGPLGLIDDAGALVVGIASATAAWKAGSSKAA